MMNEKVTQSKKIGNYLIIAFYGILSAVFCVLNIRTVTDVFGNPDLTGGAQVIEQLNADYPVQFSGKYTFVNLNGLVNRVLGHNTMNDIVKLNNGYLAVVVEPTDISRQAENTIRLRDALAAEGREFLYVSTPYLISKYDDQLPTGVADYSNANADAFLEKLREAEVPFLDMREYLRTKTDNPYELFFHTDHHWTPRGAFYGYQGTLEMLEELLQVEIDSRYREEQYYQEDTYKDWFLGASGKRTGRYFAGLDDITVIYPEFSHSIEVSIPSENVVRTGSFREAVLDYSNLEEKDLFGKNPYHVYIGDQYPVVTMRNPEAPVDKKILLLKDSFALPVQSFLSECFTQIDALDLRLYTEQSVYEYVQDFQPDIVIVMYNPFMLTTESVYEFMK